MPGNENSGPESKFTPQIEEALLSAFQRGMSVTEALQQAQIGSSTYYYWLENIPDLLEKIERAKSLPNRKSKELVTKQILEKDDPAYAKWWLERRDPDFKNRQATELSGEVHVESEDVKLVEILERMKGNVPSEPDTGAETPDS